jgi:threonine/homoserine/homoserine lactone efflux protein
MSLLTAVLTFAVVAGLVTIIPGLDTAMVLRSAIMHGRKQAFATALGINTGALIWGAGAAVGVSALLTASTLAYTLLRIAGASYMVWLGSRMLWSTLRNRRDPLAETRTMMATGTATGTGTFRSWSRGLMTNLLNPKIGAFYVAVLPQFIPPDAPHLAVGLLLALVHDLEGILWFTAIILGTHSVRAALGRRSAQRAVDGITSVTLIGFGLRLGLSGSK